MTETKMKIECLNCRQEKYIDYSYSFMRSIIDWHKSHKTRIGNCFCKLEHIHIELNAAIATATKQAVEEERERNYPFRCIVEGIASGAAFDKETGLINQHWIDSAKREIEAFEKFEAISAKGSE